MLTLVDLRGFTGDPSGMLPRASIVTAEARETVRKIVDEVRRLGDTALIEIEQRFGRKEIGLLRIPRHRVKAAIEDLDLALVEALREAAGRIHAYHERQRAEERAPWWRIGAPGSAEVGEETAPLARVGCYIPGGRAAYPSTVLMTVIPAKLAGVGEVCVSVPPSPEGRVHPATLAACHIAGVEEVYAVGGAQAIAAMAYGTETVRRVDKIVGPGSRWVTLAKHEVAMDCGVDSFAGPTEVVIIADESAPPAFVAADLIAQAEHDPLATPLLVTTSEALVTRVNVEIEKQIADASRREDIEESLRSWGRAVIVESTERAVFVANALAPEHLELALADAEDWVPRVRNAGAVFVGVWSPVALGDYIAGTNHVLPTGGTARFASPLRVSDFIRSMAVVRFDRQGVEGVARAAIQIAELEGLDAHANALRVRLASEQSNGGPK